MHRKNGYGPSGSDPTLASVIPVQRSDHWTTQLVHLPRANQLNHKVLVHKQCHSISYSIQGSFQEFWAVLLVKKGKMLNVFCRGKLRFSSSDGDDERTRQLRVFCERRKRENPEKNSRHRTEPTTTLLTCFNLDLRCSAPTTML
jgi:hypothetical protein